MLPRYQRAAFTLALFFALPSQSQSAPRLAAFHAYLFNSKTGQLSQDILAKGGPQLGNIPAGEFASVSTLIVVRVEFGEQESIPEKAQIHLIAIEKSGSPFATKNTKARDRTLLDLTTALGPVNDKGVSYVGFWLHNTGCRTITLKASAPGIANTAPLTGMLPFTCYE